MKVEVDLNKVKWGAPNAPRSALCSHLDCLARIGKDEFWCPTQPIATKSN